MTDETSSQPPPMHEPHKVVDDLTALANPNKEPSFQIIAKHQVVGDLTSVASPERKSPFHLTPHNITPVVAVTLLIISSITLATLFSVILYPENWYPYALLSVIAGGAWGVLIAFFGRDKEGSKRTP